MSTGTISLSLTVEPSVLSDDSPELTVRIGERSTPQQFGDVVISAFRMAGFKPVSLPEGAALALRRKLTLGLQDHLSMVLVAPGVLLPRSEYDIRYNGLDLDQFRRRMTPELFKVFVRYLGIIPGDARDDVNELAQSPE